MNTKNAFGPDADMGQSSEKIKVTLVLLSRDGSGVYLLPFGKYSYTLPSSYQAQGENLDDVVRKTAPSGRDMKIAPMEVGSWFDESNCTTHLILSVVTSAPAGALFVSADRPHMLGMLADNVLSEFLAQKLGWKQQSTQEAMAA